MSKPTMRAARYYGIKDIRIEQIPEPELKPNSVKVKNAYVGICGTDIHEYLGGPNFAPVTPHPVTHETVPITFGHEFSGTITELSPDITHLRVGQRVAIQPTLADGTCSVCRTGAINMCPSGGFIGLSGYGGGLADYIVVAPETVHVLPDNVGLDIGALVEPLAIGWHAVSQAPDLNATSTVLVLGGGPIGIAIIHALRARGVTSIIVSELSTTRQDFAKATGATHILDPRLVDVAETVKQLTQAHGGVDVAFDCAGVEQSLEAACLSIKPRGLVVNVAIWEGKVPFNPNILVKKEGRMATCIGLTAVDFHNVIKDLGQGAFDPSNMITKTISLEDVVEEGFKTLIEDKESHVKILIKI